MRRTIIHNNNVATPTNHNNKDSIRLYHVFIVAVVAVGLAILWFMNLG